MLQTVLLFIQRLVEARPYERELPFIATENIMMDAVEGGDRQELHEKSVFTPWLQVLLLRLMAVRMIW